MTTVAADDDVRNEILLDLTPAQRRAVTSSASPLCVLAGAGSGKTRVLTRRIAYQVAVGAADAEHTLALTFTRKAATELTGRLRALGLRDGVTAGTFHSVASASLRRWWADQGTPAPTLLVAPSRLLRPLAAERPELGEASVADLAAEVAWAQARLVDPQQLEETMANSGRILPAPPAEIAALYRRYRQEKQRRKLVDFDDLLAHCADALEGDLRFARAQHWRWRHVFVDEFQDLNPLQHRLLMAWLRGGATLSVVGDPNQAIYGWNGADPNLLDTLPIRWPEAEVVRLDENYRCSPQVVAAGKAVLGPSGGRLRSSRPEGPPPKVRGYVSDEAEAAGVAAELQECHAAGLAWSRMAVLVRTNAQAEPIRAALEAAGIPCEAPSASLLLLDSVVTRALEELRRRPALPVAVAAADLEVMAREAAGGPAVALRALAELARDYRRMDPRANVAGFLGWLPSAASRERGHRASPGVIVCSFHRAKGLEWSAVWVCGLERGLVPISQATSAAAIDEERRLLYVALTRAERDLHCSWAARRRFGDHVSEREPSPWLTAIGATELQPEPASDADRWRAWLTEEGRRLRTSDLPPATRVPDPRTSRPLDRSRSHPPGSLDFSCAPTSRNSTRRTDPEIADRLWAWRARQARAVGVPASVLLDDQSVEALASLRPVSPAELLLVPGLGAVRAARLGPTLLSLVQGAPAA